MPIYVYEVISRKPGEKPEYFEVEQGMLDRPLTKHPESGEPIRRVILGGIGVLSSTGGKKKADNSGSCCGGLGCCG